MDRTVRKFDDPDALAGAMAREIAALLETAIAERGEALLAVSGGRSPKALFRALSRCALDWSRVTVTLVDERWVPEDSAASNARLVREYLLQRYATEARFQGLWSAAPDSQQGAEAAEAHLRSLPLPFDALVLGMGEDGHTASLIPGGDSLGQALDPQGERLCLALRAPGNEHPRLTLTLPALLCARHIFLLIAGEAKWRVFEKALREGPVAALPVRALLHQSRVPVTVYYSSNS